jgi:hypothetical protein
MSERNPQYSGRLTYVVDTGRGRLTLEFEPPLPQEQTAVICRYLAETAGLSVDEHVPANDNDEVGTIYARPMNPSWIPGFNFMAGYVADIAFGLNYAPIPRNVAAKKISPLVEQMIESATQRRHRAA